MFRLDDQKYNFWHVRIDVIFLQKSWPVTENSISRQWCNPPHLDDRLHFYPIFPNLFTTRNKGKTRHHTVIFLVFRGRKQAALQTRKTTVLSLFFSFCYWSFSATCFYVFIFDSHVLKTRRAN